MFGNSLASPKSVDPASSGDSGVSRGAGNVRCVSCRSSVFPEPLTDGPHSSGHLPQIISSTFSSLFQGSSQQGGRAGGARSRRFGPEELAAARGSSRCRRSERRRSGSGEARAEEVAAAVGARGTGGRDAPAWPRQRARMIGESIDSVRNESFFHSAVAHSRNFGLLRVLLIRGSPETVLRVLYVKMGQLRGSSFVELKCSAQLLRGSEEAGSWGLTEHALPLVPLVP